MSDSLDSIVRATAKKKKNVGGEKSAKGRTLSFKGEHTHNLKWSEISGLH